MDTLLLEILLGSFVFIGSITLGLIVFLKNRLSSTNRLFFVLALLIGAYVVVNFLSLHPPFFSVTHQLWWIRVVMFVCAFIGPALVLFAHTFPHDKISLRPRYLVPLLSLMLLTAAISLSPLVFSSLEYPEGSPVPVPGPGIAIFFLDFVGLLLLSTIILIFKYRRAEGLEKSRLSLLLVGVFSSFMLMAITTIISVTIFKSSNFVFLGPIFMLLLMACIAYATVKYQLFDIKVFAAKVLAIILWVVLFSKIFVSNTLSGRFVDIMIFVITLIVGGFVVRSVAREVKQREELEKLSKELRNANSKLKMLDQARADFITIASHQLRTPPATIKWYLSALKTGDYGALPSDAVGALLRAEATNNSLISLIDDLLNASRIERGKMEFAFVETDVEKIAKTTVEQLEPLSGMKNLKLIYVKPKQPLPIVMADTEKLRQVMNNFIDNAIKYTKQGSITVKLSQENENIRFEVTDTGKGLSRDLLKNIFEKYTRGKDSATHSTGLGLGLFVAKVIIKKHKGKIWAESPGEEKGATFIFTIPVNNNLKGTSTLDLSDRKMAELSS